VGRALTRPRRKGLEGAQKGRGRRDAEAQRRGDAEAQRRGDAETQRRRDAEEGPTLLVVRSLVVRNSVGDSHDPLLHQRRKKFKARLIACRGESGNVGSCFLGLVRIRAALRLCVSAPPRPRLFFAPSISSNLCALDLLEPPHLYHFCCLSLSSRKNCLCHFSTFALCSASVAANACDPSLRLTK
jgi:hypothetical protein